MKMLRRMSWALALCLLGMGFLVFVSGCSQARRPDWYSVTGSGTAGMNSMPGQARLLARRAAILDAQRQLLEAAKGASIKADTTVEDFMTSSDYIRSRVQGIITARENIMGTRYLDDGSCEVEMKIDMNRVRDSIR